jgi:hypothetical protein
MRHSALGFRLSAFGPVGVVADPAGVRQVTMGDLKEVTLSGPRDAIAKHPIRNCPVRVQFLGRPRAQSREPFVALR